MKRIFLFLLLFLFLLSCRALISLGDNPDGKDRKALQSSPNYAYDRFWNAEEYIYTSPRPSFNRFSFFSKRPDAAPNAIPPQPLNYIKQDLKAPVPEASITWFGHSSFLIRTPDITILVDPIFNEYAGPFKGPVNAFPGTNPYKAEDLPEIDLLVISHDHYDHLDYTTIKNLRKKIKKAIVPLGVGSHLKRWKFKKDQISELDWYDSLKISETITIQATPAHHRSNRTFKDNKTLWASYVFNLDGLKIYYSGDSGYASHFLQIGQRLGPFDLALVECGQYSPYWPASHLLPEQTALAASRLGAKQILPVHWGKFREAFHPWTEPVERLVPAADSLGIKLALPTPGKMYKIDELPERNYWWRQ